MTKKRRKKKRTKTKKHWDMWQTIAMSLLAHGIIIAAIVVLGWRQFAIVKPGNAIFVNDVVIGDGENGQAQVQVRSNSLLPRGEGDRRPAPEAHPPLAEDVGEAQVHTPSPSAKLPADRHPSPTGEEDSTSAVGNAGGTHTGTSTGTGGMGSGSGTGGAGNPVLAEIRRRIESAKRYPAQAREQHIEGKVGVQFLIQPNGQVENARVTHSSGAPVLDDAAIQAVQHSAPLPYYENTIDLSLAFRLR